MIMKSLKFKEDVFRSTAALAAGSGMPALAPGCSALASKRPIASEMSEAMMNQASARPPMRPTVLASPMPARPEIRVQKIRGAMIILIRRRNRSLSMAK